MAGTKRRGRSCQIIHLRSVIRWLRHYARHFHIDVNHLPKIPSSIHVFTFDGRNHPHWRIRRRGGVRIYHKKFLQFPGGKHSGAEFRPIRFRGSFTISLFIKPQRVKGRQTIIGSWVKNRWLYKLHLVNGRLGVWLRRNPYAGVNMVPEVTGGHLVPNRWYHIAFTWNTHTRFLRLFVNGKQVGSRRSPFPRVPVFQHPGRTALGFKQDSNSEHFKGFMADIRISRGVVPKGRFIILTRLIRKFVHLHFGGFKFIRQLRFNLRPNGFLKLRWFRYGHHVLRRCPQGTRAVKYSRRHGHRCRVVRLLLLYRWLRKHAPRWHINLRHIPKPRIYAFAPSNRYMRLFEGYHAAGGILIKGVHRSRACRDWCARVRWCRAVDFNGQTRRCYYHKKPYRRIRATRRSSGVKQVWKVGQYARIGRVRPIRFHIKGFSHRYGDCRDHNIAHYRRATLRYCTRQCRRRRNCRGFIFVDRGTSSYCFLKNSPCKRLSATRVKTYHFFNKKVGKQRFPLWRLLRKNFKSGGIIHLSWFRRFRLRRCMRGTKKKGETCIITHPILFLHWIRKHHRRFHIPVKRFPQVPHLHHLYLFRNRGRGRWRINLHGGAHIQNKRAIYFPGRKGAYAQGRRFDKYRGSFTISFFVKPQTVGYTQTLIGQWAPRRWQYLFRMHKGGRLGLYLRRNRFNTGSDPRQGMVPEVSGGKLKPNRWYYVGFSWNHPEGVARMYVNGKVVGTKKTKYPDHNLFARPSPWFQLGYKQDSNNENFKGLIAHLRFTRGVLPVRRFKYYVRLIKKFVHIHFGGFKYTKNIINAFKKPFGRFSLKWFKVGKNYPKNCPPGSRKSRGRALRDRYICVIFNPRRVYREMVRISPRYRIPIHKIPKPHFYNFAPGKRRVIKFMLWHNSPHGHRLPGHRSSRQCRDYCIADRHCRAVDYNAANHTCWLHTRTTRTQIAPFTSISTYRKLRPVRPYRPRGYNFRHGDCYGHDIKHYRGKTERFCVHQCNRRKDCKSLLFFIHGPKRVCYLKNNYCHHRLRHHKSPDYLFYSKKITRFQHVNDLRKQLRSGGIVLLKWFPGRKKCWRGTKPAGKGCKVKHLKYLFRWLTRVQKRYKLSIHWFPQIVRTWHLFYFNGRRTPARWRIVRHHVPIKKRKALFFSGKKDHYATGPSFPMARRSFTIGCYVKPLSVNHRQTIIGNWAKTRFQFLFRIYKGGHLQVYLRSKKNQDHVKRLAGGTLKSGHWYYVAFSWNHHLGEAKIYVNGKVVAKEKTKIKDHDLFLNPLPTFQLGMKKDSHDGWFHGYIANLEFTSGVMPVSRMIRYSKLIKKLRIIFGGFKQTKQLFTNLRFKGWIMLKWFKNLKKCPYGTKTVKRGNSIQCHVFDLKLLYGWLKQFGPRYHIPGNKLPAIHWYNFAPGTRQLKFFRQIHSIGGRPLHKTYSSKGCRNYCENNWDCWAVDYNGATKKCYVHVHLRNKRPATSRSTGTRFYWKVGQYRKRKIVMVVHFLKTHIKPNGLIQLWWFNQKSCYPGTVKTKRGCKIQHIHPFIQWLRKVAPKYKIPLKKLPLNTVWNLVPSGKVFGHPWYYFYHNIQKGTLKNGITKSPGPFSSKYHAYHFPGKPNAFVRVANHGKLHFKSFTTFAWIKQNGARDGPILEWEGYRHTGYGTHFWIYRRKLYVNLVHNHGKSFGMFFPAYKGMFPKNKWTFVGLSYNHKTGLIILWINGRIFSKHGPRGNPDTVGKVYSGVRPKKRSFSPFNGYISGLSLLPFAISRSKILKFNHYIFTLLGLKKVPAIYFTAPVIPKPKPKPVPLLPGHFNGHPIFLLFGLLPKKDHRPTHSNGPFRSTTPTYWFPGKPGYYFNAPNLHPQSFTIFTFLKQPKAQDGAIVEWEGPKGRPYGVHFWIIKNHLFTNLASGGKSHAFSPAGKQYEVPAGKWNFVGMSYNHLTGNLVMWINGNVFKKSVGKLKLDTQGSVYVGTRPRKQTDRPFHGWLSGTSILPYAIDVPQYMALRYRIISKYYHITALPRTFWWKYGYTPPTPKPKPMPTPKPVKKETPEELPEPFEKPKPIGPTKFTKANLKPGGIFSLTIFQGLSSCPPGTTLRNGACYIEQYEIFIQWLKIHSVTYNIKYESLPLYTTVTSTTSTQFQSGQLFPMNMFKGVCPSGTTTDTTDNPPTQCKVSNVEEFIVWLRANGAAYGISFGVTKSNGETETGGFQGGMGSTTSTQYETSGGGWSSTVETTSTSSSSGGFSEGSLLPKSMIGGHCVAGTVASGNDCKVVDLKKLMPALKKMGFSVSAAKK